MVGLAVLFALSLWVSLRWLNRRRTTSEHWILSDRGRLQVDYLGRQWSAQLRVVQATYDFATARHDQGHPAEARRIAAAGGCLVEHIAREMIAQLRHLLDLERAVSTVSTVRPLMPHDFHLWRLRLLALLALVGHGLLITTSERFRFKVRVLTHAFQIVARASRCGGACAHAGTDRAWRGLAVVGNDLGVLRRESLDVVHTVLVSIEREHAAACSFGAAT